MFTVAVILTNKKNHPVTNMPSRLFSIAIANPTFQAFKKGRLLPAKVNFAVRKAWKNAIERSLKHITFSQQIKFRDRDKGNILGHDGQCIFQGCLRHLL